MSGAYYNENDAHAAQWLRNLIDAGAIAEGDVDERSIEDVRPEELKGYSQCHFFAGIGVWSYALRCSGWPDDEPVWTGSCPCQPFSSAGKGDGFADERHLWPAWHWLIQNGKRSGIPVFGEQVASPDGLAWLDLVCADMEAENHTVWAIDFCAAGVGAPHIRQRLYWVAYSDDAGRKGRRFDGDGSDQRVVGAGCVADGLADTECHGWHRPGDKRTAGRDEPANKREINGFWREADWIECTDGKCRPTEPGTQPLVGRTAFDLGSGSAFEGMSRNKMLRGYGNAIVAPQAAEFIRAHMESGRNVSHS